MLGWCPGLRALKLSRPQADTGMPVGRTHPCDQASRMKRKRATDSPTRQASARAIACGAVAGSRPFFSMNTPALAKTPRMATSTITMKTFIGPVYASRLAGVRGAPGTPATANSP